MWMSQYSCDDRPAIKKSLLPDTVTRISILSAETISLSACFSMVNPTFSKPIGDVIVLFLWHDCIFPEYDFHFDWCWHFLILIWFHWVNFWNCIIHIYIYICILCVLCVYIVYMCMCIYIYINYIIYIYILYITGNHNPYRHSSQLGGTSPQPSPRSQWPHPHRHKGWDVTVRGGHVSNETFQSLGGSAHEDGRKMVRNHLWWDSKRYEWDTHTYIYIIYAYVKI